MISTTIRKRFSAAFPPGKPQSSVWLAAIGAFCLGSVHAAPPTDVDISPDPSVLAPGAPAGTLIGTLSSTDADPGDTHTYSLVPQTPEIVAIPRSSNWNYFVTAATPGAGWETPGFDDSAWPSGQAELGYGDGAENTVIGFGGNANNVNITTYFRSTFTIADAVVVDNLIINLLRDDGAIVYINGIEAFRNNMPAGAIDPSTLANAAVGGVDETTFFTNNVDPAAVNLQSGANTIAVEIHQSSATSTDVSFDLELISQVNDPVDNALFAILGNELRTVVPSSGVEGSTFTVNVLSSDAANETFEETFVITSTANDAPSANNQNFSVDEGTTVGNNVGTVLALDLNNDTLSYAITGGNTNGSFAIHPETGLVRVDEENGIDFEATPTFTLRVSITDNALTPLTTTIDVIVDINDLNEAPDISGGLVNVQALPPLNTPVGTFAATDQDAADTLSYAIISGNTNGVFAIDSTGLITVTSPLFLNPPLTQSIYNLEVEVTDDGLPTLSSTAMVTVIVTDTLVDTGATGRYLVPTDGSLDTSWFNNGFDDSAWAQGPGGFGYDNPAADPNYLGFIQTNVSADMEDVSSTLFIRLPFTVSDPAALGSLGLNIIFEDGFVAYLNGVEIARSNAGAGPLTWQSAAGGNRDEALVSTPVLFDVSGFKNELVAGSNVLAIHGLNVNSTSSDFVIQAQLVTSFAGTPANPLEPTIAITDTDALSQTGARVTAQIGGGGAIADTTIYWGTSDGGQVAGDWDASTALGPIADGESITFLEGLDEGRTYFCSISVTNSAGTVWPAASATFDTLPIATVSETVLVAENAASRTRVPSDASEDASWTGLAFNDSAWTLGAQGVGYDTGGNPTYLPFIQTNVESEMEDRQTTVYTRIAFNGPSAGTTFDRVRLIARFDDGFIAYLNGTEILSVNGPDSPNWESSATLLATENLAGVEFDVTDAALPLLVADGPNVLAIHGLNLSLSSSDMLIQAQLIGDEFDLTGNQALPAIQALPASNIAPDSATANGAIFGDGGAVSGTVETVLVYGTSDGGTNPLLWENHVDLGPIAIGPITTPLTDLEDNQIYFYSFYAYNERGLAWSTPSQFFSTGTITLPQTTTLAATNVLPTSAEINGTFDSNGGDANTAIIFAWGTSDGADALNDWDNQLNIGASPEGTLLLALNELSENTTYFSRIFAQNQAGTSASDDTISFATGIAPPIVALSAPDIFGGTAAVLNAELLSTGGSAPSVIIFWGPEDGGTDPLAWANEVEVDDPMVGPFSTLIGGLTPSTRYYFSVTAQNAAGIAWPQASMSFYAGQTRALQSGAGASYLVPADSTDDLAWFAPGFDDSTWATGPTGIGYDESPDYDPYIGTDIEALMNNINPSVFVRIDFDVPNPAAVQGLVLRMRYDDGYIAYINGVEVARQNAGATPSPFAFDAVADAGRAPETLNDTFEDVDISAFIGNLTVGTNILAIHGLNASITSSDFFVQPEILTLANPIPDANYDAWLAGFPSLDGADAELLADPDCDLIPNILEYAFGGDPTLASLTASGEPLLPEGTVVEDGGDNFIEVTYRRRIDYQTRNIVFTGEISDTLATWAVGNFVEQGAPVPSADGITEFVTIRTVDPVSTLGDKHYGRIRVDVTN